MIGRTYFGGDQVTQFNLVLYNTIKWPYQPKHSPSYMYRRCCNFKASRSLTCHNLRVSSDFPLRLFTPVIMISNAIFQHSVRTTHRIQLASSQSSTTQQRQVRVQEWWTTKGLCKEKKFKKSESTMEVGGWVQVSLGIFFGLENHPKISLNQG